jgi:hypothetical protein
MSRQSMRMRTWGLVGLLAASLTGCGEPDDEAGADLAAGGDAAESAGEGEALLATTRRLSCLAQTGTPLALRITYRLRTEQRFADGDQQAAVRGQFVATPAGGQPIRGSVRGEMTPRQWFGGSFDVQLTARRGGNYGRFLLLRTLGQPFLWLSSEGGEPRELSCSGNVP